MLSGAKRSAGKKRGREKRGATVSRAIICHPAAAAAGERRADCCSSLSPISDCFFKAPVAEDINYPAGVNHVIYRPRPRGPRGDGGARKREDNGEEEEEEAAEEDGEVFEYGGGRVARREGVAPLPAEQNHPRRLPFSPWPQQYPAYLPPGTPKFIGDSLENFRLARCV